MNIRKIIKEELLKEVGGYDDLNVMGQHAGASMAILTSSYQILMDLLTDIANSLLDSEKGYSKFSLSNSIIGDLDKVTSEVIKDTENVLKDFTEDDVIEGGKKFITHLKSLVKRIRLISNMVSTYTKSEYEEELKQLVMGFLPKAKEYGDSLIKSNNMFKDRFSRTTGGNTFFN